MARHWPQTYSFKDFCRVTSKPVPGHALSLPDCFSKIHRFPYKYTTSNFERNNTARRRRRVQHLSRIRLDSLAPRAETILAGGAPFTGSVGPPYEPLRPSRYASRAFSSPFSRSNCIVSQYKSLLSSSMASIRASRCRQRKHGPAPDAIPRSASSGLVASASRRIGP